MQYNSNRIAKRNQNLNSMLETSNYQSEQQFSRRKALDRNRKRYNVSKTQSVEENTDSLQLFQNQLQSFIKNKQRKKMLSKKNTVNNMLPQVSKLPTLHEPDNNFEEIKNQVQNIRNWLEVREKNVIEDKLDRIIVELEEQRQREKMRIQSQLEKEKEKHPQPIQIQAQLPPPPPPPPPPASIFPPQPPPQQVVVQPYFPPYPFFPPFDSYRRLHHTKERFRHSRRRKVESESENDNEEELERTAKKKSKSKAKSKKVPKPQHRKGNEKVKARLRKIVNVVKFILRLRNEAKVKAAQRRARLEKFCKKNFFDMINNVKQWLLESQKIPLAIILEKSKLNLIFFNDESQRLRTQKKNLILRIVYLGLKSLSENATKKKINTFSQLIQNLCLDGCYPIRNLWTKHQLSQLPISEHYGFFKLDNYLQKFLITLLIFPKIFLYNMFLQPSKFDKQNFPKNQEPLRTNMKLISSVYYILFKQVMAVYMSEPRDKSIYKINLRCTKRSNLVPSQDYVYDKAEKTDNKRDQDKGKGKDQYIWGLFGEKELEEIVEMEDWETCAGLVGEIVLKIHRFSKNEKK